jgi:hypothetical protein
MTIWTATETRHLPAFGAALSTITRRFFTGRRQR